MINKPPVCKQRIRNIHGSFAWIPHAFLNNGLWSSLSHHELLLYFFLVMAANRQGVSFYSFDKICSLLGIYTDEYILARNKLIDKGLIAFDGHLFQVLSLPEKVQVNSAKPITSQQEMMLKDPATVHQTIRKSLAMSKNGESEEQSRRLKE